MSNQLIWSITRELSRQHRFGCTFQDVVKEFPDVNPVYLARILSEMVQKGILKIIFRNNYHIFPFNAFPETFAPDGHQVAKTIIQNKKYFIGYASALIIHGPGKNTHTALKN